MKKLKIALGVILLILIGLTTSAFVYYKHLEGNIATEEFITPEIERPEIVPESYDALNILIMGSDSREGTDIGGETPGLSDTTILLHISADRKFAYGVSIPRDTMVDRPACPSKNGVGTNPGGFSQFNHSFAIGGAPCTVATVEEITGIHINHFAVIDFNGFENIVNSIGGVEMCVPEEVNDSIGDIYLNEGTYVMDGKTALDYVRVRHGIGQELGDIGRMKRQQLFVSNLIEKILNDGVLKNPGTVMNLLEETTSSLTTDPEFADLFKLAGIANSLKNIGMENIQFITAPVMAYPENPNRVIFTDEAKELWELFKYDQPLSKELKNEVIEKEPAPSMLQGVLLLEIKEVSQTNNSSESINNKYGICD